MLSLAHISDLLSKKPLAQMLTKFTSCMHSLFCYSWYSPMILFSSEIFMVLLWWCHLLVTISSAIALKATGCATLMGYKKSLNMGPIFYEKKILKHGSNFLTEPKFSGFCMAKSPKKNCETWAYFSRKILNNGYPFLPK